MKEANAPEKIGIWEFASTLTMRTITEFIDDNCSLLARSLALYAFISIFSMVTFLVVAFSFFVGPDKAEMIMKEQITQIIAPGSEMQEIVPSGTGRGDASGAAGIIFLLMLVWGAGNMFSALRRTINEAWDVEKLRPFLYQKFIDLGMVIGFSAFIFMSVLSASLLSIVKNMSIDSLGPVSDFLNSSWGVMPLVASGALSFFAFTFIFWLIPNTKVKWSHALAGGLFTAFLYELAKVVFVIGVGSMVSGNAIYGTLGAVVGFITWLYIGSSIILLGAEFTSEIPRVLRGDYKKGRERGGRKTGHKELRELVKRYLKGLFTESGTHK